MDLLDARRQLSQEGFAIVANAVPDIAVSAAVRLLNLAIREHGLTAEEIVANQQTTFFPHLRWEPEIWTLIPDGVAELLGWEQGDDWAEPQLLLRFPDVDQPWPAEPHVDEPPSWSDGRGYRGIVGVALTDAGPREGAPIVWPRSHLREEHPSIPIPMHAGDALVMHPALAHSGSLNLGPAIRYAVYFRLLSGLNR